MATYAPSIPIHEFLDAFLPAVNGQHAPRVDFSAVPQDDKVAMAMGEPFTAAVSQANCCPSFVIELILKDPAKLSWPLRTYGIFSTAISDLDTEDIIRRVALVDVLVSFECQSAYDARKPEDEQETRREDTQAVNTIDIIHHLFPQIIYINTIMTLQHRTHGFSIFIVGRRAHVARWHHTGNVVSTSFDYHSGASNWLGEFLFRYAHATPAVRGYDSTIQRAPDADRDTRVQAAHYYKMRSACDGSQLGLDRTIYGSDAAYTVRIKGNEEDDRARVYVVRAPFTGVRTARGFLAWGLLEQELVCLKDTWRTEDSGTLSEAEVYDRLRSCGVRSLPDIVAGDVVCDPDGSRQYTKTQECFGREYESYWPQKSVHGHVHRRSVQRLTLPLQNSKQLILAIRDVVRAAALCASQPQDLSHRDINTSNKTPGANIGGFLDDADHVTAPSLNKPPHTYMMGTWQFLSFATATWWPPKKAHTIVDDIESCFWVFYYMAIHYFPRLSGYPDLGAFEERQPREMLYGTVYLGGDLKMMTLGTGASSPIFKSQPMTRASHAFSRLLKTCHRSSAGRYLLGHASMRVPVARQRSVDEVMEKLTGVLAIFDEALASADWPEHDDAFAKRRYPQGCCHACYYDKP